MKKILLHICCGPCSAHPATFLAAEYEVIGYFYNPNIWPYAEWMKRFEAFKKFCDESGAIADYFPKPSLTPSPSNSPLPPPLTPPLAGGESLGRGRTAFQRGENEVEEVYKKEHQKFLESVRGLEKEPEGGARCSVCFRLRLEETARFARLSFAEQNFGGFSTTLTIGRNKHPEIINPIGKAAGEKYDIKFYEANFKKQNGALKGKKISDEHGLYRQHYCGCEFSFLPSEKGG